MTIETHAFPPKWLDAIASRVKLEAKRIDKQVRAIVREQILKVIHGKAEAISPASIIGHIGLTEHQAATVERARTRLLAEGKLKGKALEKDLDKLRVKLLKERASLIAEHETRFAHAMGQQAAWEKLIAEGKLKGGRRHWHKLWVASEDEKTCGVCMDLDGQETTLDGVFADQYYAPPEPHPRCRCSIALVETTPGWRSEKNAGGPEEAQDGVNLSEGRWITKDGKAIFIGGPSGGGGGGGGAAGDVEATGLGTEKAVDVVSGTAETIDPQAKGWAKVSSTPLGGHSPATIWKDGKGDLWYVKEAGSKEQAANEVIAGKLYRVAGIPHVETQLAVVDGKAAIASRMISHAGSALPSAVGVREGFATDAWLANWDVAGKVGENTVMGPKSLATRIESGGALLYRGMGSPKGSAFGSKVGEIDTLTQAGKNPSAAYLFKDITPATIASGIRNHVGKVTDAEIDSVVKKYGAGLHPDVRNTLTATLIARRSDLMDRLPGLDKQAKAAAAAAKPQDLAPGKVYNLHSEMVKGSGKMKNEPQPSALSQKAAATLATANSYGPNWTLSNWNDPLHPRPDAFGCPTNTASDIYATAMSRAKSQISEWKGSAQSGGAQQLRKAAVEELGAHGMLKKPSVSDATTPLTDLDRLAVRVLYRKTQVDFAAAGLTNDDRVLLFRGVQKQYTTNMALEGYSTSEGTAKGFNTAAVIKKVVPPSNILFSWHTGIGSTGSYAGEKEYFVLHGPKFEAHDVGTAGSTFSGPTTGVQAPSKPSGWGGKGPLDLNALATQLGVEYKGKATMPKIELPAELASSKIAVPKAPKAIVQGSGGVDAYIAKYGGTKYTPAQIKAAFDAINEGKGELAAASASGINKHTLHGMIHEVKTKYGGVQIGGMTVVKAGSQEGSVTVPSLTTIAANVYEPPKAAPPLPKAAKGSAERPLKTDDLQPAATLSLSGKYFDKDTYVYVGALDGGGSFDSMGTPVPAGSGGYVLIPKGTPAPNASVNPSLGQDTLKKMHEVSKHAPKPKDVSVPPAPKQAGGIDAFAKKYGSGKYTPGQIAQALSMKKSGKSTAEIALALGIPVGTVHGLVHKAKVGGYF